MTYAQALWIYTILLFGIVVVPGMNMLFAVTNALTGGRKAGMALAAAQVRNFLVGAPQVTIWIGRIAGLLFVGVALLSAWHAVQALLSPSPVS